MEITDFNSLGLNESLLVQLKSKGYKAPTEIQAECIPVLMNRRDLLGIAKTGSGKTAAFCLPLLDYFSREVKALEQKHIRALILSPTRELASQIDQSLKTYGSELSISSKTIFGGVSKSPQIEALTSGIDIVVATPGRLNDLYESGEVIFDSVDTLILDEADMMLDMGFIDDVKKIISSLPKVRQTIMFSATMPKAIETLANEVLNDPVKVEVNSESTVVEEINQIFYALEKENKPYLLNSILENQDYTSVLLFCKTKVGAEIILEGLERSGVKCAAIHANKTQGAREEALRQFKEGEIRVLVATDIAARGIDVKGVSLVINFDVPEDASNYVHRVGRTGRAGQKGVAISLCIEKEAPLLRNIYNVTKKKIEFDKTQPFHKEFSLVKKKKRRRR